MPELLDVAFNQDQGCFAVAHGAGFVVYNTNPVELRVQRSFHPSGIGRVSMLHRTNYLALVGGGEHPKFPPNKVVIWDDLKQKASLSLSFPSAVLRVLLSRSRIVVVLRLLVHVYEFCAPPRLVATYDTSENPHGVADLLGRVAAGVGQMLAFPGRPKGQVQLVDVSHEGQARRVASIVKAHKARVRAVCVSSGGTMVASASDTGTLIRVHSTHTAALMFEFRRGLDRAVVTAMRFSTDDSRLAVLLDKHTLHVFALSDAAANRLHVLSRWSAMPSYFQLTWSFCSVNTNKYHIHIDGSQDKTPDVGTIGWAGAAIVVVWRHKCIWEKYAVVDRGDREPQHELVRHSWKSLAADLA